MAVAAPNLVFIVAVVSSPVFVPDKFEPVMVDIAATLVGVMAPKVSVIAGVVVAVATVAAGGTYSFTGVDINTTYSIVLSTTSGTVGNPAPVVSLPAGWVNTGEDCYYISKAINKICIYLCCRRSPDSCSVYIAIG